ncbi:hypothetical protein TZ03_01180 [Pseudomonas sp. 10-1B]|uniref:hypothetical protein n=1 Tax=Pseudomonas sp. 10-1B TaxID=1546029 RepID=UPI00061EB3D3|nr:hypothetical protein [Pseudomonas sp. 10-1B]KIY42695.1 hypothetical protein TZ03_01180 [Pseudomonas sp. 10-1B]
MSDETKSARAYLGHEHDVDAQHDEFVQNLKELMGWYGKSVKDVVTILATEPSLGNVQSSSVNAPHSIH